MFRSIFIRLRKFYDQISRAYVRLVLQHYVILIGLYVIVCSVFALGFLNYEFDLEPDSLLFVRGARSQVEKRRINETFPVHSERYFLHKLHDLGWNFEVIINGKIPNAKFRHSYEDLLKPEYNLLNRTKLDEVSSLYERILALTVEGEYQVDEEGKISSKNYSYYDLCQRRLGRCSIEGGIILNKKIQDKLIKRQITYEIGDPVTSYQDAEEVDGFSFNFLFGKYRKDLRVALNTNMYGDSYATVHTPTIRVRFDMDFTTPRKKLLATKYFDKFLDLMDQVVKNDEYKHLNISYFTSHALQKEIGRYSVFDLKFFFTGFIIFWIAFAILYNCTDIKANRAKISDISLIHKWLINRAGLFSFVVLVQLILTITSTIGALLFLGVNINPLVFEAAIMLLIVTSHQSYMLYANTNALTARKKTRVSDLRRENSSNEQDKTSLGGKEKILSEEERNLRDDIVHSVQRILVPLVFGFFTMVLAYSVIGLTNKFDAFRINSLFIIIGFAFNLLGNLIFYIPLLMLHLKRIDADRNCLFGCLKHDRKDKEWPRNDNTESKNAHTSTVEFGPSSSNISEKRKDWRDKLFEKMFNTNVKYAILAIFILYFVVNVIVYAHKYKAEIPLMDVIPSQSFLYKYISDHSNIFQVGPVVMLVLVNPPDLWNQTNYDKVKALGKEIRSLDIMDHKFEISWLNDIYVNGKMNAPFSPECENPLNLACFQQTFMGTVATADLFMDDARFVGSENSSDFKVTAVRAFYEMVKFSGKMEEVELMYQIRGLLGKHGFTDETAFVFSVMFGYLEQLDELDSTLISIFLLFVEAVFIVGLFLVFDLRTLFIQTAVLVSLVISILSNIALINYNLTIITLTHYLTVPAIICEFFLITTYNYLYPAIDAVKKHEEQAKRAIELAEASSMLREQPETANDQASVSEVTEDAQQFTLSSTESIALSATSSLSLKSLSFFERFLKLFITHEQTRHLRTKQLKSAYYMATYNSCLVLICVLITSFLCMIPVETYGFRTLVLILLNTFFNIFIHLAIFFPALLNIFGVCWIRNKPMHHRQPRLVVKL